MSMENLVRYYDPYTKGSIENSRLRSYEAKVASARVAAGMSNAQIDSVAQDFESMFLSEMMKPMFEGIEPDPMFGGGQAEDVYKSFMIDEYGKLMARTGGIGIADHVKRQLLRLQEVH